MCRPGGAVASVMGERSYINRSYCVRAGHTRNPPDGEPTETLPVTVKARKGAVRQCSATTPEPRGVTASL